MRGLVKFKKAQVVAFGVLVFGIVLMLLSYSNLYSLQKQDLGSSTFQIDPNSSSEQNFNISISHTQKILVLVDIPPGESPVNHNFEITLVNAVSNEEIKAFSSKPPSSCVFNIPTTWKKLGGIEISNPENYTVIMDTQIFRESEKFNSFWEPPIQIGGILVISTASSVLAIGTGKMTLRSPAKRRVRWWALTRLAFEYIPRHKLRNAFTVLTVIVGVALIIGVNVTFDSVMSQFEYTTSKATGNIDIAITSLQDTFDESVLAKVQVIEGVLNASARLSRTAMLEDNNETVSVIGVDSRTDFDFLGLNITGQLKTASKHIELRRNSTEAVVARSLNYSLNRNVEARMIQQEGELLTTEEKPFDFVVVGVYDRGELEGGGKTVYVDLSMAQEICNCSGQVNSVIVKISKVGSTDQIVNDLNSILGSSYVVNPVKKDLLEGIRQTTSGLSFGLQITSTIALCVSIIVVLNSMYMNVGEKTQEIGVLRSVGSSTGQIFWLFFSQSLLLGVIGSLAGVVAGVVLTEIFKQLVNYFSPYLLSTNELGSVFSFSQWGHLLVGASAGILTALAGGVFPSFAACRVNIINALRPTMRKAGKQRTALKLIVIGLPLSLFGGLEYFGAITYGDAGWGILLVSLLLPLIGTIFVTAGILRVANPVMERLLLIFGSSSKVISRNIDRNLLRSTACFTMIGLSLSFLVVIGGAQTGVVTGIEDVIKSYATCDLTIVSETNLSRSFIENLTNLNDGALITNAAPVFSVPQESVLLNNLSDIKASVTVVTIDPDTYSEVMSMTFSEDTPTDVFHALNNSGSLILTAPLALSLNVTVNDELKMPIASIVQVPTTIPNPALNSSNIPDTSTYDSILPSDLTNIVDIPSTITINVTQVKITYQNFTVVGIAEGAWLRTETFNGIQLSKTCYISYNSLNETFPKYANEANIFFAQAKSSQKVEYAKAQILNLYGDQQKLTVVTRDEILKPVRSEVDRIFLTLYTPVLFAALNAIIGVLSIMIMNVSARRREIGILRSQGMSKVQVLKSTIGEVLVLGLVGFVISLVLGLIFQSIVVTFMNLSGFVMPFTISLDSIKLALAQAVFISVLSAAYPSYRAAKLDIVDSLRVN